MRLDRVLARGCDARGKLGWLLVTAGLCLLLYPVVSRVQGAYSQMRLERELEAQGWGEVRRDRRAAEPETLRPCGFPKTKIEIPRIGVSAVVVEGADSATLRRGPGHFPGTASPGESGNCCIAAHRNLYGSWFRRLDELRSGDAVILRTADAEYSYTVRDVFPVRPTDVSVLDQGVSTTLTLVTCEPRSSDGGRLVAVAVLTSFD